MTGIPTSLLGRTRTRSGVRGPVRGPVRGSQIRRLPQSALNTISAARGRTPTRQPNIVFVRPPTRNSEYLPHLHGLLSIFHLTQVPKNLNALDMHKSINMSDFDLFKFTIFP